MITANFLDKSMSMIFSHDPYTSLRDVSFDGNKLNVRSGTFSFNQNYNVSANQTLNVQVWGTTLTFYLQKCI